MMAKGKSVKLYSHMERASILDLVKRSCPFDEKKTTIVVQGPTGFGKTWLTNDLKEAFPKHKLIVSELNLKEAGDLAMPKFKVIGDDNAVVATVPHEDLGLHLKDQPVIICWDEIFKAKRAVQTQLARMLAEGKMGELSLPKGSLQFGTSNEGDEGFGDNSFAYLDNRIIVVHMRKATADEWVDNFALSADIHPSIIAAAKEFPNMFAEHHSFDNPDDNPYIFHPKANRRHFVTGRSMHKASDVMKFTTGMSQSDRTHALIGTVGHAAAQDIMNIDALHDQLPAWKDVIKNPEKASLPKTVAAECLFVYTALQAIKDATEVKPAIAYLQRLKKETQALFASMILRVNDKRDFVSSEPSFIKWVDTNKYLYASA